MTSSSDHRDGADHDGAGPSRRLADEVDGDDIKLATVASTPGNSNNNNSNPAPSADAKAKLPALKSPASDPAISSLAAAALELSATPVPAAPASVKPVCPSTPTRNNGAISAIDIDELSQAHGTVTEAHLDADSHHAEPSHLPNMAPGGHFPPLTPSQMANLDPRAYMMMALASLNHASNAMSPPPTVTPSQVTLPRATGDFDTDDIGNPGALWQANADNGLESFARIEFADSVFQMTTYAVIIGRDQLAMIQARRDEKRLEEHQRQVKEHASKGLPPPAPIPHDKSKFSKSYVSEEGGMLGPESDSEESGRPAKRRKTSTNGSSQNENDESQENMISNRQYISHTPGAAAVDLTSLRPSPWHVPFIAIHSPGPNIANKTKAISREHLKIAYNQKIGAFEAIPLHKNGFFCDDIHYSNDKVVLKCGDRLQIKDVDFTFVINGVERGRTGAEEILDDASVKRRHSSSGKEMSFDFERSHGQGEMQDTSDELSEVDISAQELSNDEDEDVEAGDGEADEDGDDGAAEDDGHSADDRDIKVEPTAETDLESMQIPKKRGPGRPPKNGIMSKREQRLLKKQQEEMAQKQLPQALPVGPPIKRKVGRPRKNPLPNDGGDPPEKRKYKPRKPREDGGEGSDAERRAREKKEKKARPKSPPLEMVLEDYTEEQRQKPNKNYGVLIDETLTAAPDGLTLKQIYNRICQSYPYFYFHTGTTGWQSSVRHNLIGNEAFKKDETTNLWSRVPGVELDAGKKRKASSPDRMTAGQGYGPYAYPYSTTQHLSPAAAAPFAPGQTAQGYELPAYPSPAGQVGAGPVPPFAPAPVHVQTAQPAQPAQPGQAASPHAPSAIQPPGPAQVAGYIPPPAPATAQANSPQPGAYSSPYASRPPPPPPSAAAPVATEPGPSASLPQQQPPPPRSAPAGVGPVGASPASTSATQQSATPGARPSPTPPAADAARPVIWPPLLTAVVDLKNRLIDKLKESGLAKGEVIVMSALNQCVGLKTETTDKEKVEMICVNSLRQIINGWYDKNKTLVPGDVLPGGCHPVLDTKVLSTLQGFKTVVLRNLKEKVGEVRAEAVTLSAIDRVLGFADASIVPVGDRAAGLENLEQNLMKAVRDLLAGMNQKTRE